MDKLFTELLQNTSARIVYGDRWLVGNDGLWVVYEKWSHSTITTEVIRTENKQDAIDALLNN